MNAERAPDLAFGGAREGTARLAWGQRAIWNAIRETGQESAHYFNVTRSLRTPRGAGSVSVATVTAAVAALIERHDALRARTFVDADGEPYQVVSGSGAVAVYTTTSTAEEAARVAEELAFELGKQPFELDREWPLRLGLVTDGGDTVLGIALVLCHMAADGYAADVAVRDLRLLLLRGSLPKPPSQQLLDLVRQEESGLGRERSARAIAYWEEGYRRIPPMMFPEPVAEPASPRWSQAFMEAPALEHAVSVVATRYHMSTATVIMIAMTTLLGSITGHETCAVTPIVHNRLRPETRELMTTLSQLGLFTFSPAPGAALCDALEEARPHTLRAYRNAQYDQQEWYRMVDRVSAERGVRVYPSCCFNDLRPVGHEQVAGPPPDPQQVATTESKIQWLRGMEHLNCDFCFTVSRQTGVLALGLTADTCKLPQNRMVELLHGVEEMIMAEAYSGLRT